MYVDRSKAIAIAAVALGSIALFIAGFFVAASTNRKRSGASIVIRESALNDVDGMTTALNDVGGMAAASSAGVRGGSGRSRQSRSYKPPSNECKTSHPKPTFSSVYTMTNQPKNEILIYKRDVYTGELSFVKAVETGGEGSQLRPPAIPPLPPPVDDPLASTGR